MALDVIIYKNGPSHHKLPVSQRINMIQQYINGISTKPGSLFSDTVKELGEYSNNWWQGVHYKRSIMRLMAVLANEEQDTRFLQAVPVNKLREYFEMTAAPKSRLNLVVDTWDAKVPFSPHLGAAVWFCTSLMNTPPSYGYFVRFGQTLPAGNMKGDMIVQVAGENLVDGAHALNPALSAIADSMSGIVNMNGTNITFMFDLNKLPEYTKWQLDLL